MLNSHELSMIEESLWMIRGSFVWEYVLKEYKGKI